MSSTSSSTAALTSKTKTLKPSISMISDPLVQPNCEPFDCPLCLQRFGIAEGIILRDCLHEFCQKCIVRCMRQNENFIQFMCPYNKDYKCESLLSEREIKGLVSDDEYDEYICNNQRQAIAMELATSAEVNKPLSKIIKLGDQQQLVTSSDVVMSEDEKLDCPRCSRKFSIQNGIVLEDCGHSICKECIIDDFLKSQKFQMKCEFQPKDSPTCGGRINKCEIQLVLDEIGLVHTNESDRKDIEAKDESSKAKVNRNENNFWCGICSLDCPVGNGIELQTCSHHICDNCLRGTIKRTSDPEIRCPYSKSYINCKGLLVDIEIESLTSKEEFQQIKKLAIEKASAPCELYQLMIMDQFNYIKNSDEFDCPICFMPCMAGEGIKIRDCFHEFCLECFTNTVVYSDDPSIKCPFTDENLSHCESFFQEREIRAVVSKDIYEKFLEHKLTFAEQSISSTFHCKTVDCSGFGIIEADDDVMICMVCHQQNCLKCKAIHKNQTCDEYQDSQTGYKKVTESYINNLKSLGELMNCPKCEALINKNEGCSWVVCRFCKTEICWATKGPRWGPLGHGDTSGGCKCNLTKKLCHPECRNCH